jgi:hypothetical protein
MKRRLREAGSVTDGRKKLCKARSFLASTGEKKKTAPAAPKARSP